MSNTSRNLALGLIAASLVASSASAAAQKQFRYDVKPGATVSIINDYGPVQVRAVNGGQVAVTATPATSKVEIDSGQNGNRIEIRSHFLQKAGDTDGRVSYDVQVPTDANVTIRTATGPVKVQGVTGDISVDSDTGAVEVRDSSAHIHVHTVGGPVTLTDLKDGFVDVRSVGGQVTLNNVSGKLVTVNTTGGAIAYSGDFGGAGQYTLSSHSGNIDVALPANASVEVSARTVNGTVENDFPLKAAAHPAFAPQQGKSFAGMLNTGASAVRLRTFSGTIRVKKSS